MALATLLPAPRRAARSLALALAAAATAACGSDGPSSPNGADCSVDSPTGTITIGQTINGSLASSDCKAPDGSYADVYRLVVPAASQLRLTLTSTAMDAYLMIVDGDEEVLAEDDDSAGGPDGTNAGLLVNIQPGTYYVVANSAAAGETGAYQLKVE